MDVRIGIYTPVHSNEYGFYDIDFYGSGEGGGRKVGGVSKNLFYASLHVKDCFCPRWFEYSHEPIVGDVGLNILHGLCSTSRFFFVKFLFGIEFYGN